MGDQYEGKVQIDLGRKDTLIPQGLYPFRIIEFEVRQGGSGFPYISYTMELVAESKELQDWEGQRIWMNVSLSPQARWKLDEFLDAVGAPEKGTAEPGDFLGAVVLAEVVHNEWEGKLRPNINKVFQPRKGSAPTVAKKDFSSVKPKTKKAEGKAPEIDDEAEELPL